MLSVAVILAVGDAIRSVAADALVMTPLADTLAAAVPSVLERMSGWSEGGVLAAARDGALRVPGFALFAAFFILFYVVSLRRS